MRATRACSNRPRGVRPLLFCSAFTVLSLAIGACADFSGFHLGSETAGATPVWGEEGSDSGASSPAPEGGSSPADAATTRDAGTDATEEPPAAGYAAIVLADAPVAYWRLDETAGTSLHEVVKGRHGTLVGKATLGTLGAVSDGNPSITFGATPSRIDVGDHFDFDFDGGKPFTLEAWVKAKSDPDTVAFLVKAAPGNGTPGSVTGWLFGMYENVPTISLDGAYLDGPGALPVSRFSHVVVTCTGTQVALYVDGGNVATAALPKTASATPGQPLSLGGWSRNGTTAAALQGGLDEVAIYDKVLAPARIAAHAAAKR